MKFDEPTDIIARRLHDEVMDARSRLIEVIACDPTWLCPHCGQSRRLGELPWKGTEIKEAAGVSGSVGNLAFMQIVDEGLLVEEGYTHTFRPG